MSSQSPKLSSIDTTPNPELEQDQDPNTVLAAAVEEIRGATPEFAVSSTTDDVVSNTTTQPTNDETSTSNEESITPIGDVVSLNHHHHTDQTEKSDTAAAVEEPVCFEGPEKCLEVDFCVGTGPFNGLRDVPRTTWDLLLKSCGCEIISIERNHDIDSYVLSESSMFVYRWKLILKTCGKTTPLLAIPHLQTLCKTHEMEMEWMGFSRKNYIFPVLQVSIRIDKCFLTFFRSLLVSVHPRQHKSNSMHCTDTTPHQLF